jgi:hypothetical protein
MFIPIVIPTSVKTHKKWVIDMMKTSLLGGYLITAFALAPSFILGWILSIMLSSVFQVVEYNFWVATFFMFGVLTFVWDRWLRFSYQTDIKIIYTPVEYYAYIISIVSLLILYA